MSKNKAKHNKLFYEVIITLESEWKNNKVKTEDKILDLIEFHDQRRNSLIVCLYRCALIRLKDGKNLQTFDYGVEMLLGNADGKADKHILLEKKLKEQAGL